MSFVVDVTVGVMVAVVVISVDGGDGVGCSLEDELIDDMHNDDDDDDDDARWERLLTIVNASTVLGTCSSSSCKMQMTNSNTVVVVTDRVR